MGYRYFRMRIEGVQGSAAVRYHKDLPAQTTPLQTVPNLVDVAEANHTTVAVPYTLQGCTPAHNIGNDGEPGDLYRSGTMS